MTKHISISCILYLFVLLLPVFSFAECGKNAEEILQVSKMLAEGKTPDAPILLDANTFFRLQPAIRKQLGDNIFLCPKIPVRNGKPVLKQKMDFPDIWDAIEMAAASDDWETVNFIASSAIAKSLPAEALFSLLVYPSFDEKTMRKLAKTLGIPLEDAQIGWRFFLLDAFYALGGRAIKPEVLYWVKYEEQMGKARAAANARKENVKFVPFSGMRAGQAQRSLLKCGVTASNADDYISKY